MRGSKPNCCVRGDSGDQVDHRFFHVAAVVQHQAVPVQTAISDKDADNPVLAQKQIHEKPVNTPQVHAEPSIKAVLPPRNALLLPASTVAVEKERLGQCQASQTHRHRQGTLRDCDTRPNIEACPAHNEMYPWR